MNSSASNSIVQPCSTFNIKALVRPRIHRHPQQHTNRTIIPTNLIPIPIQPITTAPAPIFPNPLSPDIFKNRKGLGIIHLNIRSVHLKMDHIKILVHRTDPDVLILSESWLKKHIDDSVIALSGYNLFRIDRAKRGGGVVIYAKTVFSVSILESITRPNYYEFLALKIQLGPSPVVIVGVYRPPSAGPESVHALADLLAKYLDNEMILLGDLNLNWITSASDRLKEVCSSLNLTQMITEPTRPNLKDISKGSLIDILLSNKPDKIVACGAFELGQSDHCPIACIRSTHMPKTKTRMVIKRNFRHFNEDMFLADLHQSGIHLTSEVSELQPALDFFINTFMTAVNKHAPLKKYRIKDRSTPWFSQELSDLFKQRYNAWSRARRTGDPAHWLSFRRIRNICTSAVRNARSKYYIDLITSSYSNPVNFWKAVDLNKNSTSNALPTHIKYENLVLGDQTEICLAFNRHFQDAGNLFEKTYAGPPVNPSTIESAQTQSFVFKPFTFYAVLDELATMNTKSSPGEDHLEPFFIKLAAPIIAAPLAHIFNLSISKGIFPTVWKTAFVTPLFKGGDREDINNYRPISKLSCLAKIMETLVNNQLKPFLSNFSVLSPQQSGFRPNHSTISAVTLVRNHIVTALDNSQHCAAIFIDLSKAFDTVNHALLLEKLHNIGFDNIAHCWFRDYLSGRRQCVKAGETKSEFLQVSNGVPQGSVLGPVLFTIYINNIVSRLKDCQSHLYADDTIIYCTADSVHQALRNLQQAFNTVQDELCSLKLVLNATKTKFMLFTRAKNVDYNSLHINAVNGDSIERVAQYKYLGIWLDEKLSFKFHIADLTTKLRQKIGFLYRNKANFPMVCRKRIVEAVFMSVLDYGDVIYRSAAPTTLLPLDSVYHSALRFITGERYDTHHCILYDKVGWSSLSERRNKHWYQFIFKAIDGKLPPYITLLLQWKNRVRQTRSSNWLTLEVPPVQTELGKSAFSFDAPNTWNTLQLTLKISAPISYGQFNNRLLNLPTPVCNCF